MIGVARESFPKDMLTVGIFLGSMDAPFQPEGGQKPEPQASASGLSFVKFASKVATLSKLSGHKSPTSPTPSGTKMDF